VCDDIEPTFIVYRLAPVQQHSAVVSLNDTFYDCIMLFQLKEQILKMNLQVAIVVSEPFPMSRDEAHFVLSSHSRYRSFRFPTTLYIKDSKSF